MDNPDNIEEVLQHEGVIVALLQKVESNGVVESQLDALRVLEGLTGGSCPLRVMHIFIRLNAVGIILIKVAELNGGNISSCL
jgi:hypothetical protein